MEGTFNNLWYHYFFGYVLKMKAGDLVQLIAGKEFPQEPQIGIIFEVIDHVEVPPVCKVWWPPGVIDKEWTDELEVISESRRFGK